MAAFVWSVLPVIPCLNFNRCGSRRQYIRFPNSPTLKLSTVPDIFQLFPYSLLAIMAASHTISCSPALFTDGRDERDGAGWYLGYWAISTNGRPRQGRFHAPPPRRQPSEQHPHLSTVFVFSPPSCACLICFYLAPLHLTRSEYKIAPDVPVWRNSGDMLRQRWTNCCNCWFLFYIHV